MRVKFFEATFITSELSFDQEVAELLLKSGQLSRVNEYFQEIFATLMSDDQPLGLVCIESLERLLDQHANALRELSNSDPLREKIGWLKKTSLWGRLHVVVRAKLLRLVGRKKEALDEISREVPAALAHENSMELCWIYLDHGLISQAFEVCDRSPHPEAPLAQALCLEAMGKLEESHQQLFYAQQKANQDRDWMLFNHCVLGLARIFRKLGKREKAKQQISIIQGAILSSPEWVRLRSEIESEVETLKSRSADLVIDKKRRVLRTRELDSISMGKQYVLVEILEYLSKFPDRTISKQELIEQVWQERYLGKPHDNRVYSNLNRLRKMIEPDLLKPSYIVATQEGYRIAPKLKVVLKD